MTTPISILRIFCGGLKIFPTVELFFEAIDKMAKVEKKSVQKAVKAQRKIAVKTAKLEETKKKLQKIVDKNEAKGDSKAMKKVDAVNKV